MSSVGHSKRLRRLELRASPQIKAALAAGQISARFADELLYCSQAEGHERLARRLAAQDEVARRSKIAVEVIRRHLALGQRDLHVLRRDLQTALTQNHV